MNEDQFIEGFEACTLPASEFHHEQHVRVVWLYLRRHSLLETLVRFSDGLRRFATANGKPNLYHETISWAYVFLIHRRMQHQIQEQSWPQFVEANRDLLNWRDNILKAYYRDETLKSELRLLLDRSEIHALKQRIDELLEAGVYPTPPEDWPHIPWPPV